MDPPRIKSYDRGSSVLKENYVKPVAGAVFYISLTFLIILSSSLAIYAYVLQARYKSEKFRCETPFFHNKREDTPMRSLTPAADRDDYSD